MSKAMTWIPVQRVAHLFGQPGFTFYDTDEAEITSLEFLNDEEGWQSHSDDGVIRTGWMTVRIFRTDLESIGTLTALGFIEWQPDDDIIEELVPGPLNTGRRRGH